MWGAGCILASVIFRKRHFFNSQSLKRHILEVANVVGSEAMQAAMIKYGNGKFKDFKIFLHHIPNRLSLFRNAENADVATVEAIDLLRNLFVCDFEQRYTAEQALNHPYLHNAHQLFSEMNES